MKWLTDPCLLAAGPVGANTHSRNGFLPVEQKPSEDTKPRSHWYPRNQAQGRASLLFVTASGAANSSAGRDVRAHPASSRITQSILLASLAAYVTSTRADAGANHLPTSYLNATLECRGNRRTPSFPASAPLNGGPVSATCRPRRRRVRRETSRGGFDVGRVSARLRIAGLDGSARVVHFLRQSHHPSYDRVRDPIMFLLAAPVRTTSVRCDGPCNMPTKTPAVRDYKVHNPAVAELSCFRALSVSDHRVSRAQKRRATTAAWDFGWRSPWRRSECRDLVARSGCLHGLRALTFTSSPSRDSASELSDNSK